MNELQGLLTPDKGKTCTILGDLFGCPTQNTKVYTVRCCECVYSTYNSPNHTKLKELIPILLLEE